LSAAAAAASIPSLTAFASASFCAFFLAASSAAFCYWIAVYFSVTSAVTAVSFSFILKSSGLICSVSCLFKSNLTASVVVSSSISA
jgi:hypothetical protein